MLYAHNNAPDQWATVVTPIAAALAERWPGRVLVAHVRDMSLWLGKGHTRLMVGTEEVLPGRTYARLFNTPYGASLAQALETLGSRVVNPPAAVALAGAKFEAAAVLVAAGLPVPAQVLIPGNPSPQTIVDHAQLSWPRVLKANRGMGGESVWRVEGAAELLEHAADPGGPTQPWLVQQYRPDAAGTDVRVVVTAGRVAAAMERRAASPGEFRANLAQGGSGHPTPLTDEEGSVALRATAALGLAVAGVDLLRTNDGPLLLEVNPNPGLAGVAQIAGPSIYREVADAVVRG